MKFFKKKKFKATLILSPWHYQGQRYATCVLGGLRTGEQNRAGGSPSRILPSRPPKQLSVPGAQIRLLALFSLLGSKVLWNIACIILKNKGKRSEVLVTI